MPSTKLLEQMVLPINWAVTNNRAKGLDTEMMQLANDVMAGNIGALLIYDCNPVYTLADGKKFADGLAKLPVSVSYNNFDG